MRGAKLICMALLTCFLMLTLLGCNSGYAVKEYWVGIYSCSFELEMGDRAPFEEERTKFNLYLELHDDSTLYLRRQIEGDANNTYLYEINGKWEFVEYGFWESLSGNDWVARINLIKADDESYIEVRDHLYITDAGEMYYEMYWGSGYSRIGVYTVKIYPY